MAKVLDVDNIDTTLGTALAVVIPAPGANERKRIAFTICNTGSADASFDLTRYDSTTDRYVGKTVVVSPGKPFVVDQIFLKTGRSLKFRASIANTLDLTADVITQTTS